MWCFSPWTNFTIHHPTHKRVLAWKLKIICNICSIVCKVVQQIIKEKFQNSEYFVMVVLGSWSRTERIYPLYNITRLDGLRQMRADYKKFDTTWEQRSKKNSVWPAKKFFFSIKISDVQQKGAKNFHIFQNKV